MDGPTDTTHKHLKYLIKQILTELYHSISRSVTDKKIIGSGVSSTVTYTY